MKEERKREMREKNGREEEREKGRENGNGFEVEKVNQMKEKERKK